MTAAFRILSEGDGSTRHPLLRARAVSFAYGDVAVLAGVDFEARRGTSTAIMGRSGSGKSTLLQVLAGLLAPTAGDVEVDGQPLRGLRHGRRDDLRLHKIGFVFQFGELLPELTIAENVELPLLLLGISRKGSKAASVGALEEVGIAHLGDRHVSEVSGGEQQRAAIARALVHKPVVVLADEPTGSLDEHNAEAVLELLTGGIVTRERAIVLVTHAQEVAARCQRTLVLTRGRLHE